MSTFTEDLGRRRLLYRLAVARSDIQAAHEIAMYADKHVPEMNELWISLLDALVAAYGRPFTANKPLGPLASSWGKFDSKDDQRVHADLIEMRDQLVAHADASMRRVIIFPPNTTPPVPGKAPSSRVTLAVLHERPTPGYFAAVARVCENLLARLHKAVEDELQRLFGDSDPVSPFDLLTGEEIPFSLRGTVISEGRLPKIP